MRRHAYRGVRSERAHPEPGARRSLLGVLIVTGLISWTPGALADVASENGDDARSGKAVPLACVAHPELGSADPARRPPAGSRLCSGFIMSRLPGDPQHRFDAALDVSLAVPPGSGPFALVVQAHGWGSSKGDGRDDYLSLNEGIALLRFSARGFGRSFGDTQLADEDFEIRDIQNLVRAVVEGSAFRRPPPFSLNRKKIAAIGVSYGGAQSLLLAQSAHRSWPCGPDSCELVTAVPIAAWTDLVYALMPNGRPFARVDEPGYVLGIQKLSYATSLLAAGQRTYPRYGVSSLPPFLYRFAALVGAGEPYQSPHTRAFDPLRRAALTELLKSFTLDRSPAYQQYCTDGPIPIFMVQGWTDDLFTPHEALRMRAVLEGQCGGTYPLKTYFGNAGHLRAVADDPDERAFIWGLVRRWLRFYLLDQGPAPSFDVTSAVRGPAGHGLADEGVFSVDAFEDMKRGSISAELTGVLRVTHVLGTPRLSDLEADPLFGAGGGGLLRGLAGFTDPVLGAVGLVGDGGVWTIPMEEIVPAGSTGRTICGVGSMRIQGRVAGTDVQYAVRLWDQSGPSRYLVDRGAFRFLGSPGKLDVIVPLHGNAWRLVPGRKLVVEITNDDFPYLRPHNLPSATLITRATLALPTCEAGHTVVGAAGRSVPGLPQAQAEAGPD